MMRSLSNGGHRRGSVKSYPPVVLGLRDRSHSLSGNSRPARRERHLPRRLLPLDSERPTPRYFGFFSVWW